MDWWILELITVGALIVALLVIGETVRLGGMVLLTAGTEPGTSGSPMGRRLSRHKPCHPGSGSPQSENQVHCPSTSCQ